MEHPEESQQEISELVNLRKVNVARGIRIQELESQNAEMYKRILEKANLNTTLKAERDNDRKLMSIYQGEIRSLKSASEAYREASEAKDIKIKKIKVQKQIIGISLELKHMELEEIRGTLSREISQIEELKLSEKDSLQKYEDLRLIYMKRREESKSVGAKEAKSRVPVDEKVLVDGMNEFLDENTLAAPKLREDQPVLEDVTEVNAKIEDLFDSALSELKKSSLHRDSMFEVSQLVSVNLALKSAIRNGKREIFCELVDTRGCRGKQVVEGTTESRSVAEPLQEAEVQGVGVSDGGGLSGLAWDED